MKMLRVCAAAALMAWLAPLSHAEAADQVVFLVRHAERARRRRQRRHRRRGTA
jgi:hypothetical protein